MNVLLGFFLCRTKAVRLSEIVESRGWEGVICPSDHMLSFFVTNSFGFQKNPLPRNQTFRNGENMFLYTLMMYLPGEDWSFRHSETSRAAK